MILKSEWALHRANQVGGVVWMQHTNHATVIALLVVRAWLAVVVIENVAHRVSMYTWHHAAVVAVSVDAIVKNELRCSDYLV